MMVSIGGESVFYQHPKLTAFDRLGCLKADLGAASAE